MYFFRNLYPSMQAHIGRRHATVVTGMRRTGKTTLVKQMLADAPGNNKLYLDLERIDNRTLFSQENYDNVVRGLSAQGLDFSQKVYLAIDEIQLLPGIVSVIKYLYDNYDIKFIATGSSSYYLKDLFTESLAGRKKIFELLSLIHI